jgi:hypothetical protein
LIFRSEFGRPSLSGRNCPEFTAHVKLLDRPSACILWIFFDPDTLALGLFLWFGGPAGERIPPMGDRVAKHTKPNAMLEKADLPAHRVIPYPKEMPVLQRLLVDSG